MVDLVAILPTYGMASWVDDHQDRSFMSKNELKGLLLFPLVTIHDWYRHCKERALLVR